jgi:hypothetical protein
MGELAELTGAGRSDIIEGLTFMPLTLMEYGELERIFEARHVARAQAAAEGMPADAASKIIRQALDDVRGGAFTFGRDSFDDEALKLANLPLLAWLELRKKHPDVTLEKTVDLLTNVPDLSAVREGVLSLARYRVKKKPPVVEVQEVEPATGPSAG